jgi:hypothetical protein
MRPINMAGIYGIGHRNIMLQNLFRACLWWFLISLRLSATQWCRIVICGKKRMSMPAALAGIPEALRQRKPVSWQVYRRWLSLPDE